MKLYKNNLGFIKDFINISAPYKGKLNTGTQTLINKKINEVILPALYLLAKKIKC